MTANSEGQNAIPTHSRRNPGRRPWSQHESFQEVARDGGSGSTRTITQSGTQTSARKPVTSVSSVAELTASGKVARASRADRSGSRMTPKKQLIEVAAPLDSERPRTAYRQRSLADCPASQSGSSPGRRASGDSSRTAPLHAREALQVGVLPAIPPVLLCFPTGIRAGTAYFWRSLLYRSASPRGSAPARRTSGDPSCTAPLPYRDPRQYSVLPTIPSVPLRFPTGIRSGTAYFCKSLLYRSAFPQGSAPVQRTSGDPSCTAPLPQRDPLRYSVLLTVPRDKYSKISHCRSLGEERY
jgi:hypothetical protein